MTEQPKKRFCVSCYLNGIISDHVDTATDSLIESTLELNVDEPSKAVMDNIAKRTETLVSYRELLGSWDLFEWESIDGDVLKSIICDQIALDDSSHNDESDTPRPCNRHHMHAIMFGIISHQLDRSSCSLDNACDELSTDGNNDTKLIHRIKHLNFEVQLFMTMRDQWINGDIDDIDGEDIKYVLFEQYCEDHCSDDGDHD
jgi:hypothetical protein